MRRCSSSTSTPAWRRPIRAASRPSSARAAAGIPLSGAADARRRGRRTSRAEAARHAAVLEGAPIDLAVLGLGTRRARRVRRAARAARVGRAARRAHGRDARGRRGRVRRRGSRPARALTTGLGTLYRARELILLVDGRGEGARAAGDARGPAEAGLPRLAAARPPAADRDLRPRGGGAAARRGRGSRAIACSSCSVTASRGSAPSTGSPPSRARGCGTRSGSPAAGRCARSCSPATRRPAGCRRPSR